LSYQNNPGLHPMKYTEHRNIPLPKSPYVGHMSWNQLLFAHWPVDPDIVKPHIPATLTLETWDDKAWIGVVPFKMTDTRPRFVPPIPGFSVFPELNLRTYVTAEDQPGVWFFSLDAANPLAVWGARTFFRLPYMNAKMNIEWKKDGSIRYYSHRTHHGEPSANFEASYQPTGNVYYSSRDKLEYFLTERYCLYSAHKGKIYRGHIHHLPWPLQPADCSISVNTMAKAAGIELPEMPPLLHYADFLKVLVWPLEKVRS